MSHKDSSAYWKRTSRKRWRDQEKRYLRGISKLFSLCYLQYIHWTSFYTSSAGYALCALTLVYDNDLHRASFLTFAAACALLFVYHVYAAWIKSNGTLRTYFCTLSTLYADTRFIVFVFAYFKEGKSRVRSLIEESGACSHTLTAADTSGARINK